MSKTAFCYKFVLKPLTFENDILKSKLKRNRGLDVPQSASLIIDKQRLRYKNPIILTNTDCLKKRCPTFLADSREGTAGTQCRPIIGHAKVRQQDPISVNRSGTAVEFLSHAGRQELFPRQWQSDRRQPEATPFAERRHLIWSQNGSGRSARRRPVPRLP